MIKTGIKIFLFVAILGFILSYTIMNFNFIPLINGLNRFTYLKAFIVNFIELFFSNSYIMLFLSISIMFFIFKKLFF